MDSKMPVVRATKDQIDEFKKSILWKDIKRELGVWKTLCRREYGEVVANGINESTSSSKVLMHLGSLYGRESVIDYLLGIPEMFLQILEDSKDDTRHKSAE